jgi:hypothetical protein
MRIPHLSRRERLSLKMPRVCPTARVRSIAPSFRRRWKKTAAPARAHPPRRAAAQMQCAQPSVPPRTQRRATTMLSERRQFTGVTAPPRRHGCGLTLTFATASPAHSSVSPRASVLRRAPSASNICRPRSFRHAHAWSSPNPTPRRASQTDGPAASIGGVLPSEYRPRQVNAST